MSNRSRRKSVLQSALFFAPMSIAALAQAKPPSPGAPGNVVTPAFAADPGRAAKRVEDDDPDYEVGEEEREHVRVRPSRSRHGGSSRSGGYGGANELSELRDQWVRARLGPATV